MSNVQLLLRKLGTIKRISTTELFYTLLTKPLSSQIVLQKSAILQKNESLTISVCFFG